MSESGRPKPKFTLTLVTDPIAVPQARAGMKNIVMDAPVPEGSLIVTHDNPHQVNCPQGRELRELIRGLFEAGKYTEFEPRGGLPSPDTCQGTTKSGKPCKLPPQEGSQYCHVHG